MSSKVGLRTAIDNATMILGKKYSPAAAAPSARIDSEDAQEEIASLRWQLDGQESQYSGAIELLKRHYEQRIVDCQEKHKLELQAAASACLKQVEHLSTSIHHRNDENLLTLKQTPNLLLKRFTRTVCF